MRKKSALIVVVMAVEVVVVYIDLLLAGGAGTQGRLHRTEILFPPPNSAIRAGNPPVI